MPTLKLTSSAKPVRKMVGEHELRATQETKSILLYLLIIKNVL